jgi:hypothetical protein
MARTGTGTGPTAARKKPAPPRPKKVLAALSPTSASPEVMLPVVALDEVEAAMHPTGRTAPAEKKKDKIKAKKPKLVRDSFTMPEEEYAALGEMKKACLKAGVAVKKSELLRVAVALLNKMDMPELQQALGALTPVKAGRPRK